MGDETLSAQEKHDQGHELTDADVRELERGETPTADAGDDEDGGDKGDDASIAPVAPASGTGAEVTPPAGDSNDGAKVPLEEPAGELSDEERVRQVGILERLEADARAVRERLFGTRDGGTL